MGNILFKSMGLSICGFVFLLLIFIMFLSKKKYKTFESKVYVCMLILTLLLLLNEMGYVYAMSIKDKIPILCEILCRTYIFGCVCWLCGIIVYIWSLSVKSKKANYKAVVAIVALIISFIFLISCLFPIKYYTGNNGWYVFGGKAVIILYFIGFLATIIVLISFLRKNSSLPKQQKLPIYFTFCFFIVSTLIQMITGYDLNTLTFIFSFSIATLYFTIESQDTKLLDDLEKSKDEAEAADKAKSEFLSNMSHEIRTPLNTILGFSNTLLEEKNLTEELVKKDTKNIYDASVVLLDLINNILDISRLESGKETVLEKEYSIKNILNDVNDTILTKIKKEDIKFKIVVENDIPNNYYGDSVKITKILINILINAIKYTNYGEIVLYVDCVENNEECELKFLISNTGHAMKKENFDKTFNEFIKLDGNSENNIDSTTLGLIIAKRLLKIINGDIEFINEIGKGTRYNISIKQRKVNDEKIGNIFDKKEEQALKIIDCSGLNVLVVDDNDLNNKLASRLLKQYNFNIETVDSGLKCIEMVKDKKYDLIFLDHMMPEMDGIETLKVLKSNGYSIPPVVILTANSYSGIKDKYIEQGFYDYLAKPINVKELNIIINKLFGNK